jgi:chitin synthase
MASSVDLPPGADYWRDSSPLGVNHSSRNLRSMGSSPSLRPPNTNAFTNSGLLAQSRVPSMAGMSMWGGGSVYDGGMGYNQPMNMPPPHAGMYGNPFDSPASEHASLRPHTLFPPSGLGMGMGAPRNSVMSGLGGYGMPQTRMSSYSLATTANPLGGGPPLPLIPNGDPKPSDEEVMSVLQRYLAQQDLMSVYVLLSSCYCFN